MTDGTGILPLLSLLEQTYHELRSARDLVNGAADLSWSLKLMHQDLEYTHDENVMCTPMFNPQAQSINSLRQHVKRCEDICRKMCDHVNKVVISWRGSKTMKAWFGRMDLKSLEDRLDKAI